MHANSGHTFTYHVQNVRDWGRDVDGRLEIEAGVPRQLAHVEVCKHERQDGEEEMDGVGHGWVLVERANALGAACEAHVPICHRKCEVQHDTDRLLNQDGQVQGRHHHHQEYYDDDKKRCPTEPILHFGAGRVGRRYLHEHGPLCKVVQGGPDQEKTADVVGEAEEGK